MCVSYTYTEDLPRWHTFNFSVEEGVYIKHLNFVPTIFLNSTVLL